MGLPGWLGCDFDQRIGVYLDSDRTLSCNSHLTESDLDFQSGIFKARLLAWRWNQWI